MLLELVAELVLLEVRFCLADEIKTSGNANQVFFADGAFGELQCLSQTGGGLVHLSAYLGVHLSQIFRRHCFG